MIATVRMNELLFPVGFFLVRFKIYRWGYEQLARNREGFKEKQVADIENSC